MFRNMVQVWSTLLLKLNSDLLGRFFRCQFFLKLCLIVLGAVILGLPIVHLWAATVFLIFIFFVVCLKQLRPKFNKTHLIVFFILLILASVFRWGLPSLNIQEGNNVFFYPDGVNTTNYSALPTPVLQIFKTEFLKRFPKSSWCNPNTKESCWRRRKRPDRTYAFSSNSFWQHSKYSRVVQAINFYSLNSLGAGVANSNAACARVLPSDMTQFTQFTIPFFAMYEIPASLIHSKLCWNGLVVWETKNGHTTVVSSKVQTCKTITKDMIGQKIYGISFPQSKPLMMKLTVTTVWKIINVLKIISSVLLLVLLLSCFQFFWKTVFWLNFWFVLSLYIILHVPAAWFHRLISFKIYECGADGLTYQNWASLIVQHMKLHEFAKALRGSASVFWYTPGMRYFQGFIQLMYGDYSYLGMSSIFLICMILIARLFQRLIPTILVIFLFVTYFNPFFSHKLGMYFPYSMFDTAISNYGEVVSAVFMFGGILLLIKSHQSNKNSSHNNWLASAFLALSVIVRPNYTIAAVLGLLFFAWPLIKERKIIRAFLINSGFLLATLPLIHNLVFGHKFVIFSTNSNINILYKVPVSTYWHALVNLFYSAPNSALHLISTHWNIWFHGHIIFGILMWCALIILAVFSKKTEIRLLSWMAIGFQFPNFFWSLDQRYVVFGWFMVKAIMFILAINFILKYSGLDKFQIFKLK